MPDEPRTRIKKIRVKFVVSKIFAILYIQILIKSLMRTLHTIAKEIRQEWAKVSPYAEPYLEAMESLDSINDNYYFDSAREIVLRFLSWANTWRGDDARRIKAELKSMLK